LELLDILLKWDYWAVIEKEPPMDNTASNKKGILFYQWSGNQLNQRFFEVGLLARY
jgi:hypothetical protein